MDIIKFLNKYSIESQVIILEEYIKNEKLIPDKKHFIKLFLNDLNKEHNNNVSLTEFIESDDSIYSKIDKFLKFYYLNKTIYIFNIL